MITLRKSQDRGLSNLGWLLSRFTFSFAEYHDPAFMGFRNLRVINEDIVQPGGGFGTHGHREMEIVSWVLSGSLRHQDSIGAGGVLVPGDAQHMSAGTGIRHAEYNGSDSEPVHFLQLWLLPKTPGIPPTYEQRHFPVAEEPNLLHLIASPDGRDNSLLWNADANLYATRVDPADKVEHALTHPHAWVQLARGSATVNGQDMAQGDGLALSDEIEVSIQAGPDGVEALIFELV